MDFSKRENTKVFSLFARVEKPSNLSLRTSDREPSTGRFLLVWQSVSKAHRFSYKLNKNGTF